MNFKIVDRILVVQDQYFFDPESLIVFSKTCARDSEEKIIENFHKNRPSEQAKVYPERDSFVDFDADSSNLQNLPEKDTDYHENLEHSRVYIELHVTDDCSLRCRYCYAEEACRKYKKPSMSEESVEQSFRLARDSFPNAKVFVIILFGGEPLLYYRQFPVILKKSQEIFGDKKVEISISTNGTIINNDILAFLGRKDVFFQISCDGNREQQNRLRPTKSGKESFRIVDSNLRHFTKITESLSVRATITPYNLDLSELFTFFKKKGFKKINFGICFSGPEDIVIRKKHFPRLLENWKKLAQLYLQHVVEEETVIRLIPFVRFLRALHYGRKTNHYCGMSRNLFAVSPEGNIYSCHRFVRNEPHRIGSLPEGFDKNVKALMNIPVSDKERCRDCFAKFICGGGCPHDQVYGSFDLSCSYNRYLLALSVWIYGELSTRYPESLWKLFPDHPM